MKKTIDRREFIKKTGEGAALAGAVALAGACAPKKTAESLAAAAVDNNAPDVLETGKITLSGPGSELLVNEDVKKAYLGT